MLGADERILEHELDILTALRSAVAAEAPRIQSWRARSPRSTSWRRSPTSRRSTPSKPHVHDGDELSVLDGRHPSSSAGRRRRPQAPTGSCRMTSRSTAPRAS